jgi:metal-responsive CopG/Arc/MetJ family transcriptional regulator
VGRKRYLLSMTENDQRKLDLVAESIGGVSRSAAIRFLIRNWFDQKNNNHNDIQTAKAPSLL